MLSPIVSYTDVLLDTTTEKKFTIGIHLDAYHKFPNDYNEIELTNQEPNFGLPFEDMTPIVDKGILILNDELKLMELLPKNLLESESNNASFEIQTAIKRTLNNQTFNTHNFTYQNKLYTIICSEILEICSDTYVNGVLFIIHKQGITYPTDVPEILSIFNRVTANYV